MNKILLPLFRYGICRRRTMLYKPHLVNPGSTVRACSNDKTSDSLIITGTILVRSWKQYTYELASVPSYWRLNGSKLVRFSELINGEIAFS